MKKCSYISNEELHRIVCGNIKTYRLQKTMTQQQLAEAIDISHEYVRQLESEKGQKEFSFYTLYKIAAVLEIPIDDFTK